MILKEEISLTIQEMDLQDDVQIIDETNFIILRFDSVLLFDLGEKLI